MNETTTTITIKTNNGGITDVATTPSSIIEATPIEVKPFKKRHKSRDNYSVNNEMLLHKIAEAGLLGLLHGVNIADDKKKSWHFDKTPEIKAIIDEHIEATKTNAE